MIQFLDTHSHLQFSAYDDDREAVIARMRAGGVGTIVVGTGYEMSEAAVRLAEGTEDMWATIGVHPNDAKEGFDAATYEKLLSERVVGVGECGLDYFRSDKVADGPRQKDLFEAHIAFAIRYHLPLMLHVRSSAGEQDAHLDILAMLESYVRTSALSGTAHFFTGSVDIARRYWELGFAMSFPGVITFASEYDEVVRSAPRELILSETDAPYATPAPYRGTRNEPVFVQQVARRIAQLRSEAPEVTAAYLLANASRIFALVYDIAPKSRPC